MVDTLRDWRHAARLFVDDTYSRAPRTKFLYYVVFNINPSSVFSSKFKNRYGSELNYLAKNIDLPKYELNTELLNQYNRKTNAYSKITYQPVSISLHDDNHGTSNAMWSAYYSHYFQDQNYTTNTGVAPETYKKNTYQAMPNALYGYAGAPSAPFFDSIQLITMSKKRFQSYLLCNPKITNWSHDTMDYSDNNGAVENKLTVAYDAVIYGAGNVAFDDPAALTLHYDNGPSPIADTAPKPNPDAGQDLNLRQNAQAGTFLTPPVSGNYGNNSSLLGSNSPAIQQLIAGSSSTINPMYNTGGIQNVNFGAANSVNGTSNGSVNATIGSIGMISNALGGINGIANLANAAGNAIGGLFNKLTGNGSGSDSAGAPSIPNQGSNGGTSGPQGSSGAGTTGNAESDALKTTGVGFNAPTTGASGAGLSDAMGPTGTGGFGLNGVTGSNAPDNPTGETAASENVDATASPEETFQPDSGPSDSGASEPAPEPDYGSYAFGA